MRTIAWRCAKSGRSVAGAGPFVLVLLMVLLAGEPAGAQESRPATPARKPTTSTPRGGCVTGECHPGLKSQPFTHGPVGVDACDACHKETDPAGHKFELLRSGEQLCSFCHQLDLPGPVIHKPVTEGKCVQCHNPHNGQDRFMLRGGGGAASCQGCHPDVTKGMPSVHGPVAAGACTACHRAHSAPFPNLLPKSSRELCLECHLSLKKRLDTARTVHDPAAADCTVCHLSHASAQKMLLKSEPGKLCTGCHSQITAVIESAATKHQAVSSGAACRNCHEPHGSDYPALLLNDMVDVCLSCHDHEIKVPNGPPITNMKAVLATGTSLHGPIAQRNCVACHQIHGGSNFRLLTKEYPPEFYTPFREESYALCFSCHDRQLVLDARTDRLTNFRNGDQNLHYLHVNKDTKGRTCRACHETHASHKARHIRDSVPFGSGGWLLPVNFEKTDTGGRCSPGCHRPYGYDRANPVTNLVSPGTTTWPTSAPATSQKDVSEPRPESKEKKGS